MFCSQGTRFESWLVGSYWLRVSYIYADSRVNFKTSMNALWSNFDLLTIMVSVDCTISPLLFPSHCTRCCVTFAIDTAFLNIQIIYSIPECRCISLNYDLKLKYFNILSLWHYVLNTADVDRRSKVQFVFDLLLGDISRRNSVCVLNLSPKFSCLIIYQRLIDLSKLFLYSDIFEC